MIWISLRIKIITQLQILIMVEILIYSPNTHPNNPWWICRWTRCINNNLDKQIKNNYICGLVVPLRVRTEIILKCSLQVHPALLRCTNLWQVNIVSIRINSHILNPHTLSTLTLDKVSTILNPILWED